MREVWKLHVCQDAWKCVLGTDEARLCWEARVLREEALILIRRFPSRGAATAWARQLQLLMRDVSGPLRT